MRLTSPTFRETRKRGLSILRSEIFRRLGATAQDSWLFFFLPYYRFHPNSPSPLKPADAREKVNADSLQDVFELIFAPLQDVAHVGIPIDCADGKVRLCFPILSAWIADHRENVALHGLTTNACPKCEVPTNELGTNARSYRARDYVRSQR